MRNFIFWVNFASLLDPLQFSQHPRRIIWNNWVATNISTSVTGESELQHSENIIYRYDLQHQLLSDTYSLTNMWNCNNTFLVILIQGASVHFKSRFFKWLTRYPCATIRMVSDLFEFLWRSRHLEPVLKICPFVYSYHAQGAVTGCIHSPFRVTLLIACMLLYLCFDCSSTAKFIHTTSQ